MLITTKTFSTRMLHRVGLVAREGEEAPPPAAGDEGIDENAGSAAAAAAAAAEAASRGKTFTQEQLNEILAKEKRATANKLATLQADLARMQQSTSLTAEEKEQLAKRVEELNTVMLTKEQIAKQKLEEAERNAKNALENKTKEAQHWQTRYEKTKIQREILDQANANEGWYPEQFIPVLAPNARVVEVKDENGNPTGEDIVKIKLPGIVDGKPVTLDLTVDEAVKQLKKQDKYANFFKNTLVGGAGYNPAKGAPDSVDVRKMSPKEYMQWRKSPNGTAPAK